MYYDCLSKFSIQIFKYKLDKRWLVYIDHLVFLGKEGEIFIIIRF